MYKRIPASSCGNDEDKDSFKPSYLMNSLSSLLKDKTMTPKHQRSLDADNRRSLPDRTSYSQRSSLRHSGSAHRRPISSQELVPEMSHHRSMVFDISEEFMYEMPLPNEPQGAPVTRSHEDVALKELKEESARGAGVTTFSVSSRISRRLFGREEQLNQLLGHLERSASGARIALIHGASGVGKTSLVQEFGRRLQTMQHTEWRARVSHRDLNCADENEYRPKSNSDHFIDLVNDGATLHSPGTWIQRNVVFLFGKNDLFKRHIPYAALVQAFDPLGVMLCELQEHLDAKGGLDRLQMDFPICMNTGAGDQDAKKTGGGRKHQSLFEYMDDNDLNAILALLANEGRVLTQVIPSLRNLVDSSRPDRLTGESLYSSWSSSGFSSTDLGLQLSKRNIGFDDSPVYSKTSLGSWLALSRGSKDSVVFGESSSSFNLPSMMSLSPTPTEAMSVTSSSSDGSSFITERFILALSSFLKLFCTSNRRLVWSMDDLQWADPCSLRVIEAIASNQEICNLLVIVGYREEKTESITGPKFALTPELSAFLMCLPTKQLLDIHVDNLSLDTVSEWLANILDLPPHDDTFKDLAKAVYKKTDGKPYFVLQYLALLHRKNLLSYSVQLDMAEKRSWQWRMPEIVLLGTKSCTTDDTLMEQACVSSNELELAQDESLSDVISFRVGSMPPSVQRMVQVASCLGTLFDVELLRDLSEHCDSLLLLGFSVANKGIYGEDSQNGDECTDLEYDEGSDEASVFSLTLEQAIKEGIMEKTDDPRIYKFTHDSIQRTIYKAMSHGKERMLLHLRIGQHIMELDDERFVLDAADQLNRGSGLLVHESERLDLVQLNLKASAQALQRGGINLMADFLSKAIGLIKDNDWSMSYELILDVYNRAAGAELARGNIPSAQNRVQQVIAHGVTLEDKLPALLTSIECFAASRDYSTAIRKSRRLLAMLGERLPGADQLSFALEYRRTRNLIKLKTDNDLINLEPIVDERLEWIAKVFQVAATNGWRGGDQQFAELVFLRTMRFTLTHGSSDSTPFAYAGYGVIVSSYGDVAEGRRFADLALRQLRVRETVPAAAVLVHLYLAHLQRPAAESLEPLLASYRIGLEIGELTFGALALEAYASLYLFCGLPLGSYVNDMQAFCGQLRLFNQVEPLTNMLPMLQLALNMTGQSTNVLDCSWDACGSQHNFGQGLTLEPTSNAALLLDYVQMFNAYVFNALDVAREAAQRANHSQLRGTHIINIFYAFIDSLVHFALYRRDKKRADYKMAKRAMQQLEWADERSQNCSGMMLLLVAEKASFKSENGVPALKKIYNYAISQLLDDGYLHFAAIANERAGEFFADEDPLFSCVCLSEAVGLYAEWEAAAKITALQRAHPSLQPRKSRQSVRGLLDIVIPDL